jgi:hypothetical protein
MSMLKALMTNYDWMKLGYGVVGACGVIAAYVGLAWLCQPDVWPVVLGYALLPFYFIGAGLHSIGMVVLIAMLGMTIGRCLEKIGGGK